ncbi:MAG: AAA family ATPase, partial [Oscillospiraceae bacterium]|nr:AAA family ATPase [Oscillospiraceae bacterium]
MVYNDNVCDEIKPHLLEYLGTVSEQRQGNKWNCPICGSGTGPGGTPAFSLYEETNSFYCHSCGVGGSLIDLYKAMHKTDTKTAIKELAAMYNITEPEKPKKPRKRLDDQTRAHDYYNADGSTFGRKVVYKYDDGSKNAQWFLFDTQTGQFCLNAGLQGRHAPLYDLPWILNSSGAVYITEGEKDADTLKRMGLTATTAPNGASAKWKPEDYNAALQGREVVILTDNDTPGRKYGRTVADGIQSAAQSVKLIQATDIYKDCPEKGDISDIAQIIGQAAALDALNAAVAAAPEYNPATAPDDQSGEEPRYFEARRASEVEEDHTRFTWYPYLPAGDYSVLMAAGGTGKSFFCCGVAAAISSGEPLPEYYLQGLEAEKVEPKNVLLISGEDRAPMLRKRLEASGANLDNCFILDINDTNGLLLPAGEGDKAGNATWNHLFDKYRPEFVMLDPWHCFLPSSVDINKVNAVRQVLHNIAVMCQKHDCSMLLVSHVNKKAQGENANNAATGSSDLVNAGRSALQLIFDGSEGGEDKRIVVHTKSNYAVAGKSIVYRITSNSGIEWDGFSEITRDTLEEAARTRQKPADLLANRANVSADRHALLEAVTALSEPGKAVKIRYNQLIDDHGEDIFCGRKPRAALESIAADLLARGITLKEYGKFIRATAEEKKAGAKDGRGFVISCMTTPEEMTGALP